MDVTTGNTPAEAGVDNNTLTMITELRGNTETVETPEVPVEQVEVKPETPAEIPETVAEPAAEDEDKALEERRNALLREIAIDPGRTQQYVQRTQTPASPEAAPALPFDEFSFDKDNPEHIQALFDARLNEVGGPLFEKIDAIAQRFEQEDQQRQEQQMQEIAVEANQKTVALLDTYIPGFSGIAEKYSTSGQLDAKEKAVFAEAVNAESVLMNHYASQISQQHQVDFPTAFNFVTHHLPIRAEIAQRIGPEISKFSKELGLVAQPSKKQITQLPPEQKQEVAREMYVESSNAVPASTASGFDKAASKGDTYSMIAALRAK